MSTIPGWKRTLGRVLGRAAPSMTVKNDFDGALLSRDPTVGAAYLADPLNQHVTTTRFGAAALAEQARVRPALGRLLGPDARLPRRGGSTRADRLERASRATSRA